MNTTQQQCFMIAVKYMNFTRAAEQLYITQPALSRNISALEEELGLLLFVRHNNVLEVTPGAKILYDWMQRTNEDFAKVLDIARNANTQDGQALHIGFIKSELPSQKVAQALQYLRTQHPEVRLSIAHYHSRDIITRLEEHNMDIAVMIGSATYDHPRLLTKKLAGFQRCIAVPINHRLAFRERVSIADLGEDTFVSVKPQTSPTFTPMIQRVCGTAGFVPKIVEAGDTDQQIEWIESGRGVGLLVDNHAQRHNPLLSFIELEEELPVELVCTWDRLNANPHIPKLVEAFTAPDDKTA